MRIVKTIITLVLLMTGSNCIAQLCQGSLGDPVVNITFGKGPNPGNPLTAATTTYNFVTTSCPNDGMYTVVSSTANCFGDSWHTLTQDHTGDGSGYVMLVNASYEPGDFYVDTVHGLCANTTYEFAAWVVNVLKTGSCVGAGGLQPIRPNLTFSIETLAGTILQTRKTGDILEDFSPTWKQYALSFRTPPGVDDVIVHLRNNAPGGCGNDLAIDDITFRACGPQVTASIAAVTPTTSLSICDDDKRLYPLSGKISAGFTTPAYQWQVSNDSTNWTDIPNATSTTYNRQPTVAGTYYYRLAVAEAGNINSPNCRIVSNNISFRVNTKPVTSAGSNSPVCEGTILSLTADGGSTYQWQGPNNYNGTGSPATIDNVTRAAAGKYFVTVTSSTGCIQKDSVVVSIKPKPAASAGADEGICEDQGITLNASGGGTYSWQPSTGLSATNISNPVASPIDSTTYIVTVTDNLSGCNAKDTVLINVFHKPTANAGIDKTMTEGDKIMLTGNATGGGVNYYWTPNAFMNNANSLQPVVSPPHDTTYTLHVESTAGCGVATDDVFIKVFKKVLVPNAFSPNKDGINDTWQLVSIDAYPDADINVFNRYGQPVFTSRGYNKQWDGNYDNRPLPVGTYYYVIDLKFRLPKLKGWVAILR
jgi:gliding motility-associated-like protein